MNAEEASGNTCCATLSRGDSAHRGGHPPKGGPRLHESALVGRATKSCSLFVLRPLLSGEEAPPATCRLMPRIAARPRRDRHPSAIRDLECYGATLDDAVGARQIRASGDPIEKALGMVDIAFLHDAALPDVNDTLPLVPALPAHGCVSRARMIFVSFWHVA